MKSIKPKSRSPDPQQAERFKETARKLGADESPDAFDKLVRRVAPQKKPAKPKS
jgi:hypothetical protein